MYQCPCYLPTGQRCQLSNENGYCFNHFKNLTLHICPKEYTKNLKIPGYNNLIARQLLIKVEEKQMKQKEKILNIQEELVDQELRHAIAKKNHEEYVKRKTEVLEERKKSARKFAI